MAILSLSQAAKAVGVSRSTIYKQVKQGQLSATRLPDGSKGVDTSELLRVFGELHSEAGATEAKVTSPAGSESAVLQRENELLRQQLHAAHEREQRFLAIIEDQQQRLLPPPRKGFLERLADAVNRIRGKY